MNDLVVQFATAKDAKLQRAALVSLIKSKQIHAAAKENTFYAGVLRLGQEIQERNDF